MRDDGGVRDSECVFVSGGVVGGGGRGEAVRIEFA